MSPDTAAPLFFGHWGLVIGDIYGSFSIVSSRRPIIVCANVVGETMEAGPGCPCIAGIFISCCAISLAGGLVQHFMGKKSPMKNSLLYLVFVTMSLVRGSIFSDCRVPAVATHQLARGFFGFSIPARDRPFFWVCWPP